MGNLPYFCWFPKDAETDEAYTSMTDAEVGFYHRCLNRSWLNGGLPVDPKERAKALNKKQPYADKMWLVVGKRFLLSECGRMVNGRQEKERIGAITKSDKARRSAELRWSKDDANALPTHSEGNARGSGSDSDSPGVETTNQEKPPSRARSLPAGYDFDEQYAEFRSACKSWGMAIVEPEDFVEAWREWGLLDPEQRFAAIAGIRQRELEGADPAFALRVEKYLKKREWKRAIVRPQPAKSKLQQTMDRI